LAKILHIIHSSSGGTGSYFIQFLNSGDGHTHTGIAWGQENISAGLREAEIKNNIHIKSIPKFAGPDLKAWYKVYREIVQHAPDVVVLHSITAYPAVFMARKFCSFKLITVVHTWFALQSRFEKFCLKRLAVFADEMIVFSAFQAEKLRSVTKRNRLIIIPHGIDTNFWLPPEAMPLSSDGLFHVGVHSRLIPWKNIALIIRLVHACGDKNMRLHIAGTGVEWNELKKLVSELQMESQVLWYGDLDTMELRAFLQNLQVWMLFSKGETMGLSAMEAIACGVPVLLSGHPALDACVTGEMDISLEALSIRLKEIQKDYTSYYMQAGKRREYLINIFSMEKWIAAWGDVWK